MQPDATLHHWQQFWCYAKQKHYTASATPFLEIPDSWIVTAYRKMIWHDAVKSTVSVMQTSLLLLSFLPLACIFTDAK